MSTILMNLMKRGMVTSDQFSAVKKERPMAEKSVQELLILAGHLKGEDLFEIAKEFFPVPVIDLDQIPIDPQVISLIPLERARYHGVLPVRKEGDSLLVAMSDPSDIIARDEIGFLSGMTVKPLLCLQGQISEYINTYYRTGHSVHEMLEDAVSGTQDGRIGAEQFLNEQAVDLAEYDDEDSSFVRLINKLISDAVEARASDIHIEPQGKAVEVRYRIDGYLKSIIKLPRDLQQRLAVRIKLLAKLDITEKRKAQDGRIKVFIDGKKVDLRISVIPVFYGEKIVLRILDTQNSQYDLKTLGFQPDELETFREAIHKPQGVVLVTGPTGSGKTTTLYAAMQHIKSETKNIVTIEDPIEYLIDGINQLQLSRHKDMTFASGLKSILRQDPDVILVGEIRDRDTAEIALRASLTGHLVFSTLHTNGSVSSITRLVDIGIEPYLIASSVNLFVAQRLIRLVCPHCCEEVMPEDKLLIKFANYLERVPIRRFYKGKGCDLCNFSGFFGRTSIFEILKVDGRIRELVCNKASEGMILKEAMANGMRTLAEAGVLKVAAGLTTLEEIARVVDVVEEGADELVFN